MYGVPNTYGRKIAQSRVEQVGLPHDRIKGDDRYFARDHERHQEQPEDQVAARETEAGEGKCPQDAEKDLADGEGRRDDEGVGQVATEPGAREVVRNCGGKGSVEGTRRAG